MYILFLNLLDEFYLPSEFGVIIIILKISSLAGFTENQREQRVSAPSATAAHFSAFQPLKSADFTISSHCVTLTRPKTLRVG